MGSAYITRYVKLLPIMDLVLSDIFTAIYEGPFSKVW